MLDSLHEGLNAGLAGAVKTRSIGFGVGKVSLEGDLPSAIDVEIVEGGAA